MILARDEIETIDRGTDDPVWWIKNILGINLWPMQEKIARSVVRNRRTVVKSCHAMGKSTVAAASVLNFSSTHEASIAITTATSDRQVRGILWRELRSMHAKARFPLGGRMTETKWTIRPVGDWWAWGFTAPEYDPSKFQGFHAPHVLVVVDEAAGVPATVYEGLDSAMASGDAHSLEIGNPTDQTGPFGQAFRDGEAQVFSVSAFDTPNFTQFGITLDDIRDDTWRKKVTGPPSYPFLINPQWVREKWIEWTRRGQDEEDPRWMSRVLARFPTAGTRALIPMWWIEEAQERWEDLMREGKRPVWAGLAKANLGVDVARDGADNTERALYEPGWGVRWVRTAPRQDTMATAGMVLDDIEQMENEGFDVVSVRTDADGLGAGVHDRLRETIGERAVEIRSGRSAKDKTHFRNARGEMLWNLRELLDPSGRRPIALPPDPELARQLAAIQWDMNSSGQRVIEEKAMTKRRLGCSPDKADAVAYSAALVDRHQFAEIRPSALDGAETKTSSRWRK